MPLPTPKRSSTLMAYLMSMAISHILYVNRLLERPLFCTQEFNASLQMPLQVIQDCTPDGPISPATCTYFQNWLDF